MKVLLVEDDAGTASYIAKGFAAQGLHIEHAADGIAGLARARSGDYQAIILHRLLPGRDGLSLLRGLRRGGMITPVLYLTAMDGLDDRVEGLEAGGDDYLVKPFFLAELLARIHALVRRAADANTQTRLRAADIELDLIRRKVTRCGREIALMPRGYTFVGHL